MIGPPFVNPGGIITVVGVHPAQRCTSPLGVVLVGPGDGVGDCHDTADLQREGLFISLFSTQGGKISSVFGSMVYFRCMLLSMLVTKREPTPGYHDASSVGTPMWAVLEKGWQNHCKSMVSNLLGRFFLVSKRTLCFFGRLVAWMLHIGRARHPGPGMRYFTPGQLSWGFGVGFLSSVPGGN